MVSRFDFLGACGEIGLLSDSQVEQKVLGLVETKHCYFYRKSLDGFSNQDCKCLNMGFLEHSLFGRWEHQPITKNQH